MTPEHISLILALASIFGGILTLAIKATLKSNCTRLKCCGCECQREHEDDASTAQASLALALVS
jgi:hypothetical protein